LYWKYKSRAATPKLKISTETVVLIKDMARDNRLWGAERIRGELLKLGIHVSKRTIQKYMRQVRTTRPHGQTWATFLRTHAEQILRVWGLRRVSPSRISSSARCSPSSSSNDTRAEWSMSASHALPATRGPPVPLQEATAFGEGPKYLIRDHDGKFGVGFARVAQTSHIEILTIPYHAPQANAICERFLGSVRRECLDHLLILQEKQLHRVLNAYMHYFNRARPHQGIRRAVSGAASWVSATTS
jgi:putative transposase